MSLKETEAIVLRTYNLAEADKIVVCLTKDSGVIRGVARGARRLKSRFGAGLEPSTVVSLTYFEKEGRELVSLSQVEILHSYFKLAQRTEIVSALAYMTELVMEFSPPNEPNEKIFRMARAALDALEYRPDDLYSILRYFEIWILKLSGFYPDIRTCSNCGMRLSETRSEYVVTDLGVCCGKCACHSNRKLSTSAYNCLCSARYLSPLDFAEGLKNLTSDERAEVGLFTGNFIGRALERKPLSNVTTVA